MIGFQTRLSWTLSLNRRYVAPKWWLLGTDAFRIQPSTISPSRLRSFRCLSSSKIENVAPARSIDHAKFEFPELSLYNTMTRSKQRFVPQHPPKVTLYVCGVTVYDFSHLGHARAYVSFDLLYRLLCALGYDVFYVRNFTDIDDKIIKRASELQESPEIIAERFIEAFSEDMETLGCAKPSSEPKATEFIPQMIEMIQSIVEKGHGYVIDGDVFFNTASIQDYGRLSKRAFEDNRPGERVTIDERKRHPSDFALWKSAKDETEPSWVSPWGEGRPGWHIECSAMIREEIGATVDIHGGGSDLIFPHHENELAQSQAAAGPCEKEVMLNGMDFVRYWMHNGFVNIDEVKMSKSLGNFLTIRDVLESHHAFALRWMLLSTQYRQPLQYSDRMMQEAETNVYYLCQTLVDAFDVLKWERSPNVALEEAYESNEWIREAMTALCDDLNSSLALAIAYGQLSQLNELLHSKKGRKDKERLPKLEMGCKSVICIMQLAGFDLELPRRRVQEMKDLALKRAGLTEREVENQIEARNEARSGKDYAKADALREALSQKGIAICDSPDRTTWRPL